ncbi:MAG TPA: cupin domain-containing protein [Methyloceanibacter sp.]|nr:cupin domain-containing protein [Methyloceanibacter sp.]
MSLPPRLGSIYPAPFGDKLAGREKRALGDALQLTQFGVNLVTLAPGAWSSQRHWHANEDEFIYVLQGEVTLRHRRRAEDPYGGDGCRLSRRQGRWASSHQSKR